MLLNKGKVTEGSVYSMKQFFEKVVVLILYSSYIRCHQRRELGKGVTELCVLFLNFLWVYNYIK